MDSDGGPEESKDGIASHDEVAVVGTAKRCIGEEVGYALQISRVEAFGVREHEAFDGPGVVHC